MLDEIDADGWRDWLKAEPDSYPATFGIAVDHAQDDDEARERARYVEQRIVDVARAVSCLTDDDFAYYTKDHDGFLVPAESESCRLAYTDTLDTYLHRLTRGLETQVLFHADIPADLHKDESPNDRPFSALLNVPTIRRSLARRLAQLRNVGHNVLPPGFVDQARRTLGPNFITSRLDSLAHSTLVDYQVLIGSSGMREYKDLKEQLLSDDRGIARKYQEAIWRRTGNAFLVAIADDGRVLEYASPPSARLLPEADGLARDVCRQQAAVPLLIDGRIQCTVVVGAFLRQMLRLAPHWLYMNCTKDPGDLEKVGNAASYISSFEWTKSGLVHVPDRKRQNIIHTGQDSDGKGRRVSPILPEVGPHREHHGELDKVYSDTIFPRFSRMMAAYDITPDRIFLMGGIEEPQLRAHLTREMHLSRVLPLVVRGDTVIRRYADGRLEEREAQTGVMMSAPARVKGPVRSSGRVATPSCTIGDGKACSVAVSPGG